MDLDRWAASSCSMMSRLIEDAPTTDPFLSRIVESVTAIGNVAPCLRIWTVSKVSTGPPLRF
jgi:hypothetical protein